MAAPLAFPGVGVRVEVDHRHPAPADVPGDPGRVGEGDRVVAAQDHRDRARRGDLVHHVLEPLDRLLNVARRHENVPDVGDPQLLQRVHAERQVRPGPVMRQVVGGPDRPRPEPGPRPVRRSPVERRPDEDDVVLTRAEVGELHPRHSGEGDLGPVHRPVNLRLWHAAQPISWGVQTNPPDPPPSRVPSVESGSPGGPPETTGPSAARRIARSRAPLALRFASRATARFSSSGQ